VQHDAGAAGAADLVIASVQHERHLQLLQTLAQNGALTITEAVVQDCGREVTRLSQAQPVRPAVHSLDRRTLRLQTLCHVERHQGLVVDHQDDASSEAGHGSLVLKRAMPDMASK
jgi:hypothetical protein